MGDSHYLPVWGHGSFVDGCGTGEVAGGSEFGWRRVEAASEGCFFWRWQYRHDGSVLWCCGWSMFVIFLLLALTIVFAVFDVSWGKVRDGRRETW